MSMRRAYWTRTLRTHTLDQEKESLLVPLQDLYRFLGHLRQGGVRGVVTVKLVGHHGRLEQTYGKSKLTRWQDRVDARGMGLST